MKNVISKIEKNIIKELKINLKMFIIFLKKYFKKKLEDYKFIIKEIKKYIIIEIKFMKNEIKVILKLLEKKRVISYKN